MLSSISIKMLVMVIRIGKSQNVVRIANREALDQTASEEAV